MPKDTEEPLVKVPEFDEKQFLFDEKERAKSIVMIFIIGAVIGILSGYLQLIGYWYFSVLLLLIVLVFSEYILKGLGVKVSKKTTHRILFIGELFLTWIVFWILVLNPPFSHVSGPEISNIQMFSNGGWTSVPFSNGVYNIAVPNDSFRVYVFAYSGVNFTKVVEYEAGGPPSIISSHLSGNYLYFNLTNLNYDSTYYVSVYASTYVNGANLTSEMTYHMYASITQNAPTIG
ncbi:TVG1351159 [Thermoplasma volcanium GSS1]|uniref:TVG1351159 protein n=1 Tax=Thermoplasma volcanium (strain ATCC 51530 / DSM 4299 / JCM 9571 / NBRC 15438 / GSS1) TaxID=273116 RepID=Q978V6_THEVO|nr:hypothetical protein [Thermoplasma volcanium]BAB60451.1 TVG1351159 [Thermoplasma volcanium GSS1]